MSKNLGDKLIEAVLNNDVQQVKEVINESKKEGTSIVDVVTVLDGRTPLILAVLKNEPEIVKILVEDGNASVDYKDRNEETAVILALKLGYTKIANYLIGFVKDKDHLSKIESAAWGYSYFYPNKKEEFEKIMEKVKQKEKELQKEESKKFLRVS
jgi:ankyrin repeat protein